MVVERSRASYLIDALEMPKVEGSNPAISRSFLNVGNGRIRSQIHATSIFIKNLNSKPAS